LKTIFVGLFFISFFFACKKDDKVAPERQENTTGTDSTKHPIDSTLTQTWPDSSRIEQARQFPGLVGANVQRLDDQTVSLDFDHHDVAVNLLITQAPQPWFMTGLYAPAGEKITLDLPSGIDGLSVQIGAWTDDLYGNALQNRSPLIFVRKKLKAGEN